MVLRSQRRLTKLRGTLDPDANKYSRGIVAVAAGSLKFPGAALLAVGGARRGNAGYVKFLSREDFLTKLVIAEFPDVVPIGSLAKEKVDALVVGPGGATIAKLPRDIPIVLDSAAISLATEKSARIGTGPIVITPHQGELKWLGDEFSETQGGKLESQERSQIATSIAERFQIIVVLKGRKTVVTDPSGRKWIDEVGGPELATAGSGDILAGIIGSMLTRCKDGADPFEQVCAAVELHSRAGKSAAKKYGSVTTLEILESLAYL